MYGLALSPSSFTFYAQVQWAEGEGTHKNIADVDVKFWCLT